MGDARMSLSEPRAVEPFSGIVLWDLQSCDMSDASLEIIRKRIPRLAHELGIPQPYRNLRIEVYEGGNGKVQIATEKVGKDGCAPHVNTGGVEFYQVSSVNDAINARLNQLTDCPKPLILVSGVVGSESKPGPIRVGWELYEKELVVVCRKPEAGSTAEQFLKEKRIKTYGWPPKVDRDFESLLFHLNPAHEFPQGTNQVIHPVVFVAGVAAVVYPVIYSVVTLVI
ncbi:hypothetical protein BV898_03239 [Hypsibius exemplaris]|uniref:Uncharacterized protein n=1 Tax=Hypsibius exemplaris TaxID=2072580 RepID=A0A1W0X603_HYPEX|nr:hypothetical protein BV898_03239 [Hypsibius exemplaris]